MHNFYLKNHAHSKKRFFMGLHSNKRKQKHNIVEEPKDVIIDEVHHGAGIGINMQYNHANLGAVFAKNFDERAVIRQNNVNAALSKPVITNNFSPSMSKIVSGMGNLDFSSGIKNTKRKTIKLIV